MGLGKVRGDFHGCAQTGDGGRRIPAGQLSVPEIVIGLGEVRA
jgi:hypothetical protein